MPRYLVAFSLAGEQRELVRAIATVVRRELGEGKVFLDEWFEHLIGGQDADVKLQKIYGEDCELAVVCVSGQYGNKPWTLAEHEAIRARYMKARVSPDPKDQFRVFPIRVGDGDVPGIPSNAIVLDVRQRSAQDAADLIVKRLREIVPAEGVAKADWPEKPPALRWPMADHFDAREAFAALLTRDSQWRCLLLRGASESGKSHITRQMLANALRIEGLDCGRFEFKGTTRSRKRSKRQPFPTGSTRRSSPRSSDCRSRQARSASGSSATSMKSSHSKRGAWASSTCTKPRASRCASGWRAKRRSAFAF